MSDPNSGGGKPLWMLLEDDQALRNLLVEMFKLWGRTALTFPDGFRAAAWLDAIESGENKDPLPQVALMDIRVPGPQGPEIAQRMRKVAATSHIPIVIMTAYRLDPVEMQEITDLAHPDGFIHKGEMLFDDIQTTLERVVREALDRPAVPPTEAVPPVASESASPADDAAPAVESAPVEPAASPAAEPAESTPAADAAPAANAAPANESEKGVISVDE
jgi:CheY-like chemotaxis protein